MGGDDTVMIGLARPHTCDRILTKIDSFTRTCSITRNIFDVKFVCVMMMICTLISKCFGYV